MSRPAAASGVQPARPAIARHASAITERDTSPASGAEYRSPHRAVNGCSCGAVLRELTLHTRPPCARSAPPNYLQNYEVRGPERHQRVLLSVVPAASSFFLDSVSCVFLLPSSARAEPGFGTVSRTFRTVRGPSNMRRSRSVLPRLRRAGTRRTAGSREFSAPHPGLRISTDPPWPRQQ
jgi:hypothetical protein